MNADWNGLKSVTVTHKDLDFPGGLQNLFALLTKSFCKIPGPRFAEITMNEIRSEFVSIVAFIKLIVD